MRLLLSACVLLVACAGAPAETASTLEQIRCEVLEAALDAAVPRNPNQRLALRDSTAFGGSPGDFVARRRRDIPDLDSTALLNFAVANSARRPSCPRLPSGAAMVLVSDSAQRAQPATDLGTYWNSFYASFPRTVGLTWTSAIGLSDDRRQALLLVGHQCNDLCGEGSLVLLGRSRDGKWRVLHKQTIWVS